MVCTIPPCALAILIEKSILKYSEFEPRGKPVVMLVYNHYRELEPRIKVGRNSSLIQGFERVAILWPPELNDPEAF